MRSYTKEQLIKIMSDGCYELNSEVIDHGSKKYHFIQRYDNRMRPIDPENYKDHIVTITCIVNQDGSFKFHHMLDKYFMSLQSPEYHSIERDDFVKIENTFAQYALATKQAYIP